MSTDDTVTAVDINDDLNAFESEFFGEDTPDTKTEVKEPEEVQEDNSEENVDETEDDSLANSDEDEDNDEQDEDSDADETDDEEEDPKPKKNRKSARERIEELVAKNRETERSFQQREADLLRRLEQLEAQTKDKQEQEKPGTHTVKDVLPDDAPQPDAVDKDGEPLYPLGEYDPLFVRDLTKYTFEQQMNEAREQAQTAKQQAEIAAAQAELTNAWVERVDQAEKNMPDLRDRIVDLTETFQNIEPNYGEYLASTIMSSEVGPEIMYYLSQNIGEAQKIVASGPAAATLALGRLEARFQSSAKQEDRRNVKQVSKAPAPPQDKTKGRGGRFAVAPDTDDLNAFERVFFKD
jgi:hypothetical protein